jgi:hypothetical protein
MHAIASYPAMGGPRKHFKDGPHFGGPTQPGTYVLLRKVQHVSHSWTWSKVRWGARLKEDAANNDVLFEDDRGAWESVSTVVFQGYKLVNFEGKVMSVLEAVKHYYAQLTRDPANHKVPATWVFNDFGHATWYMFVDKDGDGKFSPKKGEKIHSQFIHTTPLNEYQWEQEKTRKHPDPSRVILEYSHGCIHVKPQDFDEMVAKHYLKSGTHFVVHSYATRPKKKKLEPGYRGKKTELHFFPSTSEIIVYAQ